MPHHVCSRKRTCYLRYSSQSFQAHTVYHVRSCSSLSLPLFPFALLGCGLECVELNHGPSSSFGNFPADKYTRARPSFVPLETHSHRSLKKTVGILRPSSSPSIIMGKEGIRYAAKVDLEKPASEQDCLHVSTHPQPYHSILRC